VKRVLQRPLFQTQQFHVWFGIDATPVSEKVTQVHYSKVIFACTICPLQFKPANAEFAVKRFRIFIPALNKCVTSKQYLLQKRLYIAGGKDGCVSEILAIIYCGWKYPGQPGNVENIPNIECR